MCIYMEALLALAACRELMLPLFCLPLSHFGMCVYVYEYVYVYLDMDMDIDVDMYIDIHIYTYININIYMYTYVNTARPNQSFMFPYR